MAVFSDILKQKLREPDTDVVSDRYLKYKTCVMLRYAYKHVTFPQDASALATSKDLSQGATLSCLKSGTNLQEPGEEQRQH